MTSSQMTLFSIWGATYSSYLSKLKTLQNKAIRIIFGAQFRETAKPSKYSKTFKIFYYLQNTTY